MSCVMCTTRQWDVLMSCVICTAYQSDVLMSCVICTAPATTPSDRLWIPLILMSVGYCGILPSSAEVQNGWSCTPTSSIVTFRPRYALSSMPCYIFVISQ